MTELLNVSESAVKPEGKILVIDDDPFILNLIKTNLEVHNFEVLTASSGFDGLSIIKQHEDLDLVVLDLMMPKMDGYEVATQIREKHSIMELPVLILTAKSHLNDMVKGFKIGANDYLAKPFKNEELFARTMTLVQLKQTASTNSNLLDAIDLKNQFINMTIHDLKNPLGVIQGVMDMLKIEVNFDESQLELMELAETSTTLMLNLVEELLDAAKIESGKLSLNTEEVYLTVAVQESIDSFYQMLEKKGQKVHFSYDEKYDSIITADKIRLKEILDNLISNAIKYSPYDTEITISVTHRVHENKYLFVRFGVKDHGPGLTADDLKKVFGSFQKLSAIPTGGESSSGLGLSIVKKLVEYHHGKIWVESVHGKGCEFIVEFPAQNQKQLLAKKP